MQNVQQKLNITDNGWEMQVQFTTEKPVEEVWGLIGTTEGYSKWFPEIRVDEAIPNKMAFIVEEENFHEDIPVLHIVPHQHIQYNWTGAILSFSLHKLGNNSTKLIFCEEMPNTFPHPAKDMAGWAVQINRLSELCEGETIVASEDIYEEWLNIISNQMTIEK